jgi:hypothetical protein
LSPFHFILSAGLMDMPNIDILLLGKVNDGAHASPMCVHENGLVQAKGPPHFLFRPLAPDPHMQALPRLDVRCCCQNAIVAASGSRRPVLLPTAILRPLNGQELADKTVFSNGALLIGEHLGALNCIRGAQLEV